MDDPGFLAVLAVGLMFVSGMLAYRLGGAGRSRREIATVIVHVWVVFVLAATLFWAMSRITGVESAVGGQGMVSDLREVFGRIGALAPRDKALLIGGWVVAISLFIALLRRVNAALSEPPDHSRQSKGE